VIISFTVKSTFSPAENANSIMVEIRRERKKKVNSKLFIYQQHRLRNELWLTVRENRTVNTQAYFTKTLNLNFLMK
jgi:hypothetical protein